MTGAFGQFIAEHRKKVGLTLRGLASELGIAPAYMSDIEKGHRYPPDKDKLALMAKALKLTATETNEMYDLAAGEKENGIAPDLPEYIMNRPKARTALRMARDEDIGDDLWQKMIDMMEEERRNKTE